MADLDPKHSNSRIKIDNIQPNSGSIVIGRGFESYTSEPSPLKMTDTAPIPGLELLDRMVDEAVREDEPKRQEIKKFLRSIRVEIDKGDAGDVVTVKRDLGHIAQIMPSALQPNLRRYIEGNTRASVPIKVLARHLLS